MSATSFIREAFKPYLITGICSNYQDDKRNDKMNCGFICYLFIIVSCVKDINIHLFTSIRSLLICFSESRWVQTDVDSYWSDVLCADPPYLLLPQVENTHTRTHTYLASNTSNLYSDVIAMFRSLSRWKCVFRWRERELAFCTGSRIKLEGGTYSKFKKGNLP